MSGALITWAAGLLGHALWLGVAGGLFGLLGAVAGRQRPRLRHDLAGAGLLLIAAGLLVMAFLTWPQSPVPSAALTAVVEPTRAASAVMPATSAITTAPVVGGASIQWSLIAVESWLAGALAITLWHANGWRRVRQWRRTAQPASFDLIARLGPLAERMGVAVPRLGMTTRIASPAVMGWWRPLILLPASLVIHLPPAQLEALLLHELAHLKRRDWLIAGGIAVMEMLLFFHPAVWWLGRTLRQAREECCDALAVTAGAERRDLAAGLLALAERLSPPVPALAARSGSVIARVARLLGVPVAPPRPRLALMAKSALPLLGGVLVMATAACMPATARAKGSSAEIDFTPAVQSPWSHLRHAPSAALTLDQRIQARLHPQVAVSGRLIVGTPESIAWFTPARQARLLPVAEVDARLAADARLRLGESPQILSRSAQTAETWSINQKYGFIADYALMKGHPSPVIAVANSGSHMIVGGEVEGDGVRLLALDYDSVMLFDSECYTFTTTWRGEALTCLVEETVNEIRSTIPLTAPALLGRGDALAIPFADPRIERSTAQIRGRMLLSPCPHEIKREASDPDPAARVLIITAQPIETPRTGMDFTASDDPAARAWLTVRVSVDAQEQPLPTVLARLVEQSPVPLWIATDADAEATLVTLHLADATWQELLLQLLPQTLLTAKVRRGGIVLSPDLSMGPLPSKSSGRTWRWCPIYAAVGPIETHTYEFGGLINDGDFPTLLTTAIPEIYAGAWGAASSIRLRGTIASISAPANIHRDLAQRLTRFSPRR